MEFERYADDAVVHCDTERPARAVRPALADRLTEAGPRLHPAKTKIVYCKDGRRRGPFPVTAFTFLGYTFRPRGARRADGKMFVGFPPAASPGALKEMGQQVRRWRIHTRTRHHLGELASEINPIVAGWMNYFGRFYRPQLYPVLQRINTYLMRWAGKKHKRLRPTSGSRRGGPGSSIESPGCSRTGPGCAHSPDCDEKSGVTGDDHAPFYGNPGVRFPRATRPECHLS